MVIKWDRQQNNIAMGGDRAALTDLVGKSDRSVNLSGLLNLLHQTACIGNGPMLGDLAVLDSIDPNH
jgi:hypothetical protein